MARGLAADRACQPTGVAAARQLRGDVCIVTVARGDGCACGVGRTATHSYDTDWFDISEAGPMLLDDKATIACSGS